MVGQIQKPVAGDHCRRSGRRLKMAEIFSVAVVNDDIVVAALATLADKDQIARFGVGRPEHVKAADSFAKIVARLAAVVTLPVNVPHKIGLLARFPAHCPAAVMTH